MNNSQNNNQNIKKDNNYGNSQAYILSCITILRSAFPDN